jgi:hypothetical protein
LPEIVGAEADIGGADCQASAAKHEGQPADEDQGGAGMPRFSKTSLWCWNRGRAAIPL